MLTVDVVWMLAQDVLVQRHRLVVLVQRLQQTRQVVVGGDADGVVVRLVVLRLRLGALQRLLVVFLQPNTSQTQSIVGESKWCVSGVEQR